MVEPENGGWERPNIYDVACRAGVSQMTVSRVLNGHPHIRESTRARVLQVIKEMSYTPSSIARALVTQRARRIGVLIDSPEQSGVNTTVRALEEAAREVGYTVSTSVTGDNVSQIELGLSELVTQGIEALCVIAPRESALALLRPLITGLSTILIEAEADLSWHTISIDQRMGATLAVQHLIALGHRTIVHVAGPMDWYDARDRAQGWRECLAEAGLPEGQLVLGDWTSDFGFEFGRSFDLGATTAVFAANDQTALGVIHGLHVRGVRVPEEVSVVGFDDLLDAHHFLPPLTTVRQNFAELGRSALLQLIAGIEGNTEPTHHTIRPHLIVRESTTMAASA